MPAIPDRPPFLQGGRGGSSPPAAGGIRSPAFPFPLGYPRSLAAISAATFSPDSSMPPKIGPMR